MISDGPRRVKRGEVGTLSDMLHTAKVGFRPEPLPDDFMQRFLWSLADSPRLCRELSRIVRENVKGGDDG